MATEIMIVMGGTALLSGAFGIIGECCARMIPNETAKKTFQVAMKCLQVPSAACIIGFTTLAFTGVLFGVPTGVALGLGAFIGSGIAMISLSIIAASSERKYLQMAAKVADLVVSIITKLSTIFLNLIYPPVAVVLGAASIVALSGNLIDIVF